SPVETQLSIQTRATSSYSCDSAGRMTGVDIATFSAMAAYDASRRAAQPRCWRAVLFLPRPRPLPAERHTTSEICVSCRASGLVLRQTMPMVRDGCGFLKRATDTAAERGSTETAISRIKVTPAPAVTPCTRG